MIVFDFEVDVKNNKIQDIGAISTKNMKFHDSSIRKFLKYVKRNKSTLFAGHNVISFDLKYLKETPLENIITPDNTIDTLYLSALIFAKKTYHKLVKDDKLTYDEENNPLNDSIRAFDLFHDCVNEFKRFDLTFKDILYLLLKDKVGFKGFFQYINYQPVNLTLKPLLIKRFSENMCLNKNIDYFIKNYPIELSFALSYINAKNTKDTPDTKSSLLPPWLLNNFSKVEEIVLSLRNDPCDDVNCSYCRQELSGIRALNWYFKYPKFREFDGVALQEDAVSSAIKNESLVAVFPTGGGKSLTFQLPALISGDTIGGLTVVISPLQSLMKDQVDNLSIKNMIHSAAYINGLQNPIERKETIDRILDGSVNILYIAPESLRSKTIQNLLLKRQVVRFVIDEAHCFSTWGHDFRPDYLYIGDFITLIKEKKRLDKNIPVSCFTATAKQDVIEDIIAYFKDKNNLEMKVFKTTQGRKNLNYHMHQVGDDDNRYVTLRNILESISTPTIIYSSRIKVIEELYKRLMADGKKVSKFHGKMDNALKIENQEQFMKNETQIMVATNAFGMGVDKEDIGTVIHYNVSDSLENYVQEAGRAGRKENAIAQCHILYNENDLDKHFEMLNFSKVSQKEISQVWNGIKRNIKNDQKLTKTTLELSKMAGWDENTVDIDTRIKTSLLALEDSKFIKRGLNSPKVYATSLKIMNVIKANKIIDETNMIPDEDKQTTKRIIKSIISNKRKSWDQDLAESRVDVLADYLSLDRRIVLDHIQYLRNLDILADQNDLYAKINDETKLRTLQTNLNRYHKMIDYLLSRFTEEKLLYNLKELNDSFKDDSYQPNIKYLKKALNFMIRSKFIGYERTYKDEFYGYLLETSDQISKKVLKYFNVAEFIITYLMNKFSKNNQMATKELIDFSIIELKNDYQAQLGMFLENVTDRDMEDVIFMLHYLDVLSFEGGFFVVYSPLTITKTVSNQQVKYTKEHYKKLSNHYEVRNQQIHIVGHYANLVFQDKEKANLYVYDYFNLKYMDFIDKYFPGKEKKELNLKMSKQRHSKLFKALSVEQLKIIDDHDSKSIGVAAGPGSGKTTLLVHKLASIIYNEDIKTEQLLMLTFSRNAALEFRARLKQLVDGVANRIQMTTFHSFCFDLLGKPGSLDLSKNIVKEALELIENNEADEFKMTKLMIVIDEAQDMDQYEYQLIEKLVSFNEDIRVLAVGDDDQNVYEFRGSDSQYLKMIAKSKLYELSTNYRSKKNIVKYANILISKIKNRLKTKELVSNSHENGMVEVHTYQQPHLIIPVVEKVINDKRVGSKVIITNTNEEAVLVSGYLKELKIKNKHIQDLKDVNLFNIYEFRSFYNMLSSITEHKIDPILWHKALNLFTNQFSNSIHFDTYKDTLDKFFEEYQNPYLTDLKEFLNEYKITHSPDDALIVVANMHKVKGLEFDNVYLMYEDTSYLKDEKIRALYVSITRAKSFLSIHTTHTLFKTIKSEDVHYIDNNQSFELPKVIELHFGLEDVYLDYSSYVQHNIIKVLPGCELQLESDTVMYGKHKVGKLSKKGMSIIEERYQKQFELVHIYAYQLIYWYSVKLQKEILVLLPELSFKKK